MKIALVLSSPPGYSETFFNSQIKGLQALGHEVTLYTGKVSYRYKLCKHIMHPAVHRYRLVQVFLMCYQILVLIPHIKSVKRYVSLEKKQDTPLKRIIEKMYLNAALLKFKGDWVHFGFATVALDRELVPQAVGAKMAVSLRGYDMNVYPLKHRGCYELLWKQVDKVHAISRYLLNKAYELGLDTNKPFKIIHPAVHLENLPKHREANTATKYRIVTIARFSWIKGLELLTEVALILKNKGLDFEWTIIGTGNTAELERYLFDVHEKKLQNQIINVGQTSHDATLKILNECDVYVQTSLNEGFCNALLEAQALGVPCVAFKVGGIPENVVDDETGWLVEPFDTLRMAEKIQEILDWPREKINKITQRSKLRVRNDFNLIKQREAFNDFYKY